MECGSVRADGPGAPRRSLGDGVRGAGRARGRRRRAGTRGRFVAAAGIIVVHNHPSGDPTPSADDRSVTRQLVDAGRLLDVPVYDHVIVGGDRYLSFAEAGLL